MSDDTGQPPTPPRRAALWRGAIAALGVLVLALAGGVGGLALFDRALPLPQWTIAQIENRLSADVQAGMPDMHVTIQSASLSFDRRLAPVVTLSGAELRDGKDIPLMALPQTNLTLSRLGILAGKLRLRDVHLIGAKLAITRDLNGQLDFAFASGAALSLPQSFALFDQFFASEIGAGLRDVTLEDMGLSLHDLRSNQRWALAEGLLNVTHRDGAIAADLGLTMAAQSGRLPTAQLGRVDINLVSDLEGKAAQISARLSGVSTKDLAQHVAPLAFMSVLDAPITGQVVTTLTAQGLSALQAQLTLGAGALAPNGAPSSTAHSAPLAFQSAQMEVTYDPADGRLKLNNVQVTSNALRLRGGGYADALRADGSVITGYFAGELPSSFAVRLSLDSLQIAQSDVFDSALAFSDGQADLTLRLAPFSAELTQAVLEAPGGQMRAKGKLAAQNGGWQQELDLELDQLSARQLLAIWPKTQIKGTRDWLKRNLHAARFHNIALRVEKPALQAAQIDLGFQFDGLVMTPMRGLPPITGGAGYGAITDNQFSIVLQNGIATPPRGGALDLAQSRFVIPDIRQFPATGQLTLRSQGAVTATLSLLDQPPFGFLTKAGRAVDFAQGQAKLTIQVTLPLQKKVTWADISLRAAGTISDFASEKLAAGHLVAAPQLDVRVSQDGLHIDGAGQISSLPFTAAYRQPFGKNAPATVTGQVELTDAALRLFGVNLPQGSVAGKAAAQIVITAARGQAAQLNIESDLRGIALAIPALGYEKPAQTAGAFAATIALSSPAEVTSLTIKAGDLSAQGAVRLGAGDALMRASFSQLRIGELFDGEAILTANGADAPLALTVPRGTLDLRQLPPKKQRDMGPRALAMALTLEQVKITNTIALSNFQGDLMAQATGLSGDFSAQIPNGPEILGALSPVQTGTAIRITSQDAGAALALWGVYPAGRGGALDLLLTPQETAGHYLGNIKMKGLRVQSSSILAELLNAISVVGLLEQLAGQGILFNTVSADFLLTPTGVELRDGVATGGALGVTMQGVYQFGDRSLQMQGVISPIYLINGLGAVVSKRGEGVLGFNFTLGGTADEPKVQVNPLSVLFPGFLRNIFKMPPAKLDEAKP